MDIISSADNSKFQRRAPSKVYPDKEGESIGSSLSEISNQNEQLRKGDEILLSEETKQTLQAIEKELAKVVQESPLYGKLFFSSSKPTLIGQLNSISSLFKLPQYQALLEKDQSFQAFHDKVVKLGDDYQATLHRYQDYLRSSRPITYAKPNGFHYS